MKKVTAGKNYYITKHPVQASICAVLMVILFCAVFHWQSGRIRAQADGYQSEAWILCKPADWINVRLSPSKKSRSIGYLECGDNIWIDGKTKNGFVHLVRLGMEYEEGWVYAGYVTTEQPEMDGGSYTVIARKRVACRRWMDGPQIDSKPWITNGTDVQVYARTETWSITSRGYIKSEYLERNGE